MNKSFMQVIEDKEGTIYADFEDRGYRCLVMRGPMSLCAYIGVKPIHPFFGKDYSKLYDEGFNVDCHGGLTFSGQGEEGYRPIGYWWLGWDYAHLYDAPFYDCPNFGYEDHKWTPEEVEAEIHEVVTNIINLAEQFSI